MANMYAYGEKYKVDPEFALKALKRTHTEWNWYYRLVFNKIEKKLSEDLKKAYTEMMNLYFE
jgi:hypothetical protein